MVKLSDNLDETRANLLRELKKRGGEANTSELKKAMGAENPQSVKYRMKDMAEKALVEEEHQGLDGTGSNRPNLYRLTEDGRFVLENFDLPGDGFENEVEVMLKRLNERVRRMQEKVRQIDDRVEEIEERIEEVDPDPDPWGER